MRRRHQRGMTLVEVTVATVIFSMIMLATVTAFRSFAGTYAKLEQQTAGTMEMREVDRFLRATLRRAINRPQFFDLAQDSLHWVAPIDRVGGVVGLQHLRLARQGDQLMLSFAPVAGAGSQPAWDSVAPPFPLINKLEKIRFAYQSTPQDPWTGRIESSRSQDTALPNAVALEIVSDCRVWPPMVIQFAEYRSAQ